MDAKAHVLAILGKPEKAMSIIKEVMSRSSPDNPYYLATEGFILYKLGKYDEALAKFD
jgi:tetratricopeptide (TPR) repeat protein